MKNPKSASMGLAVLLAGAFAAPAAGVWWLTTQDNPIDAIDAQRTAVYASPTSATLDGRQPATANMFWSTGAGLVAPGWTGTVTAFPVAPGDLIEEGSIIVEIDGVDRIAAATESPFYRLLGPESVGDDVSNLNQFLGRLGLAHARADDWTPATSTGVRTLQARLGIDPQIADLFDPAWTVWLPTPQVVVGTTAVTLGSLAPSPGAPFITPLATLVDAILVKSDGSELSLAGGSTWTFSTDTGTQLPIVTSADGTGRAADLQALSAVVATGQESVSGVVALTDAVVATALPITSIVTDGQGGTCVWLRSDDQAEARPWTVTVLDGDVSATYIKEVAPADSTILVNPSEALSDPGC